MVEEIKSAMERQAATRNGLQRRVTDLEFSRVADPRQAAKVKRSLPTVLTALVAAMVTKARSLRMAEQRTAQMGRKAGDGLGVNERIADNTFGKVLCRLDVAQLVACLHRLVKAEHRRGNLQPTVLPWGTVAVDGKNVATLRWHDLCRVLDLERAEATTERVRELLAERYPQAQLCVPESGMPYALVRAHTVTLTSSVAAPAVHLRPIAGETNEVSSMPALVTELKQVYGRTRLFEMLTTDAGNTSLETASRIVEAGWQYFSQIKSVHCTLHEEAVAQLAKRRKRRCHASCADKQNGLAVTYHLWRHDLTDCGWMDWTHARQLVRVQRTTENLTTGEVAVGNRFYVTSKGLADLSPQNALSLSRAHWRCEDETHWTLDAELGEDRRRLAWSRHPVGVLTVSALRMIALAILAVARRLSRFGHSRETPSWTQVAEHFLLQLCGSILQTEAFDIA
jgi:hypothetical protein